MARNDLYLYVDATSPAAALITSKTNTAAANVPDLVLGDVPAFNFYFTNGTGSWPDFAGNANYTMSWALSPSTAQAATPFASQTSSTAITGGWSMKLPVNAALLISSLTGIPISQEYPVVRLWQHIRVSDSDGNPTTYALLRTNVRLRAL